MHLKIQNTLHTQHIYSHMNLIYEMLVQNRRHVIAKQCVKRNESLLHLAKRNKPFRWWIQKSGTLNIIPGNIHIFVLIYSPEQCFSTNFISRHTRIHDSTSAAHHTYDDEKRMKRIDDFLKFIINYMLHHRQKVKYFFIIGYKEY